MDDIGNVTVVDVTRGIGVFVAALTPQPDAVFNNMHGKSTEELVFMEINTQPGCTPESIGPSQVVYKGMSFSGLCKHLIETASVKNK